MNQQNTPAVATVHGFPRQGPDRELKKAIEAYWAGRLDADALTETARELRAGAWRSLAEHGVDEVPTGDFSLYDHVLDTTVMVDAVPERYRDAGSDLDVYFAMARGDDQLAPLEMTKWFDTNYHYLVPELGPDTVFTARPERQVEQFVEARDAGLEARPVLVGPYTYLALAKAAPDAPAGFDPLSLLEPLTAVYAQILTALGEAGASWVQIDEPALVLGTDADTRARVSVSLQTLADAPGRPKLLVASYFAPLGPEVLQVLADSPVEGVALDLVGIGAEDLPTLSEGVLSDKRVVAGVVDGRNIWAADLADAAEVLSRLAPHVGHLDVGASSSLLHVPIEAARERRLDDELRSWLTFALEKAEELAVLRDEVNEPGSASAKVAERTAVLQQRADSPRTRNTTVRERVSGLTDADARRDSVYAERVPAQQAELGLPVLPTTTIGSFPQTGDLRRARAALRRGDLDEAAYTQQMKDEVAAVIALQEELDLDVLVHGEPERNDMVQYFAEQLDGYAATSHGWVQSYGTRCVRPPVLFGDVSRPEPMTVEWWRYAQSLTDRPVKGMLTGPVTMLAWSFVRDDQPVGDTARQVALALRDEVSDLEAAGCRVVQVDEPALRETLPLRASDRADYLAWATESFRLSTSSVADATQVHTHMCYAEFGDVLEAIDEMDADVISLEAARSGMALAEELKEAGYGKGVGPGVYDIHSPRVPGQDEVDALLQRALANLAPEQVWVNPDCGLKTRGTSEVKASLGNLTAAARAARERLGA